MPRIARNILFLLLSQIISVAAAVLVLAISARYLGPDRFGQQSVLRAIAVAALPLIGGGLRVNMAKEIGRDPAGAPSYLGNVLMLRWAMATVTAIVAAVIIHILPLSPGMELAAYVTIFLALAGLWDAVARAIFIAYERNHFNVAASILSALLTLAFTTLAIKLDAGIPGIIGAAALSQFITAQLALQFCYRRFVRPKLQLDFARWREILHGSLPVGLSSMLKRSYAQVDIWLLAALRNSEAAGMFSVAYRVTTQVTTTSVLVGTALLPRLSLLARNAKDQLRTAFEHLLLFALAVSVPAAGLLSAFAAPLVMLVVGPKFVSSVEALRLVSIVIVTALPDALLFFCLVAIGKETLATTTLAISVAANIVFDLALIPLLGVRGACFGTIGAEWIYFIVSLVIIHRNLGISSVWRYIGKPLVAGIAMAIIILAAGKERPFLAAGGGLLAYAALVGVFRMLPRGMIGGLRRAFELPSAIVLDETGVSTLAEEPA